MEKNMGSNGKRLFILPVCNAACNTHALIFDRFVVSRRMLETPKFENVSGIAHQY